MSIISKNFNDIQVSSALSNSLSTSNLLATNITTSNIFGTSITTNNIIITTGNLIAPNSSHTLGNLFSNTQSTSIGTGSIAGDARLNIQDLSTRGISFYSSSTKIGGISYPSINGPFNFNAGSNTGQLSLSSTGNIGIGTSSPSSKLEINNGMNSTYLRLSGDAAAQQALEFFDTASRWVIYKPISTTDLRFLDGSADRLTIKNGGNVGIGTVSPDRLLEIRGSVSSTTREPMLRMGRRHNSGISFAASAEFDVYKASYTVSADASTALTFRLGDGASDNPNLDIMTLWANGRVGIGTTSPTGALHVTGNTGDGTITGTNTLVLRSKTHAHPPSIVFDSVGENTGVSLTTTRIVCNDNGLSGANLRFLTNNNDRVVILHGGNVGIGTTNPANKLTIQESSTTSIVGVYGYSPNPNNTGSQVNTSEIRMGVTSGAHITLRSFIPNGSYVDNNFFQICTPNINNDNTQIPRLTITGFSGYVGIGTASPSYQLQLSSDSAGKPNGGTWANSSDQRLKENIELADLNLCYNIIKALPLKRYRWKDNSYTDEQIKDRNVLGWIAQDVISIFPKAVEKTQFTQVDGTIIDNCLTLNETMINRTLYGAVQQLIRKNEIQETELQTTKQELATTRSQLNQLFQYLNVQPFDI